MAEAIVATLIENSLIFCALFGGVLLVKRLFAKRMSVRLHYLIWAVVVIKLLVPLSVAAPWSPGVWVTENAAGPVPQAIVSTDADTAPDSRIPVAETKASDRQLRSSYEQRPGSPITVMFGWMELLLYLWLAGIAVYIAWLWYQWHRLQKAMRCRSLPVPDRVKQIFLSCKQSAGVKREVTVMMQDVLHVPAATGLLRPVVLIPMHCAQNTEQLEHAFFHELTHIKRRDIAVIWGLNILRMLYWFNPLVWLCFQLIQRDMEADCDSMAVEVLGSGKLSDYIDTILYFSGKDSPVPLQAAMSWSNGCARMKRRISSLFMKKRTQRPVKMAVSILIALMMFAAFTSGCVSGAQNADTYVTIEQWKDEDIALDNVTIHIDAPVLKPNREAFSVYETKLTGFSPEQIDKTIAYFFGDNKPDSEQRAELVKTDASRGVTDATTIISGEKWEGGKILEWSDTDGGKPGNAYIVNTVDYSGFSPCIQISAGRYHYFDRKSPYDRQPEGVTLKPEEALQEAQEMLDALGLNNIKPTYVYACSAVNDETGEYTSDVPGGYDVICIAKVNGMNAGYAHEYATGIVTQETIDIYVNDSGVVRFDWLNHWENGAATVKVSLLPLDDIKRIFRETMIQKYQKSSFKMEETVNKVVMELARVNTGEEWRLVPAWCFYATSTFWNGDEATTYTYPGALLLAISAIDGTVIE